MKAKALGIYDLGKGAVCLRRAKRTGIWHFCSLCPQGCWSHHLLKVRTPAWMSLFDALLWVRAFQLHQVWALQERSTEIFGDLFCNSLCWLLFVLPKVFWSLCKAFLFLQVFLLPILATIAIDLTCQSGINNSVGYWKNGVKDAL